MCCFCLCLLCGLTLYLYKNAILVFINIIHCTLPMVLKLHVIKQWAHSAGSKAYHVTNLQ